MTILNVQHPKSQITTDSICPWRRGLFYKQMVNTRCIPLTFAPEDLNSESLAVIRAGDAFLASGDEARFDNGAGLVAAAMR